MAGPFGSVGTDYRELQAPEQVDTNLPNNEAELRAAALSGLFKEFEGISGDYANQAQTQAGAIAGAAAGATGHPQYRQGLERFTAYSRAFNNAATGAYAIEAQAQADDAAARLRVQANNDPNTFRATFSAVRDGVLKQAPAMAVPMLTELYNQRLAEGIAAISGDQATQRQQLQRQTYDLGIQKQTSRVAILQGSADPHDQLRALDEQAKLSVMIDGGVNAGLYSKAEAQAMHVNAMRQVTAEVFETQVDREIADPNGDVVTLLDRFRQAHIANISNPKEAPILSEDEFNKLMMDAKQKIIQNNMTLALTHRQGADAQAARWAAGDQKYTAMALDPHSGLSLRDLSAAVTIGDVKPSDARAIRTLMLNRAEQPKTDYSAVLKVSTDPNFLGMSDKDIINTPGINSKDALDLIKQRDRRNATWEGTQSARDARAVIVDALKVPKGPGAPPLSTDQQKAVSNALVDFTARMNKVDPAARDHQAMSVAQQVVADEQKRLIASEITALQQSAQRVLQAHGHGSADEWSSDKLKAFQQDNDAHIQALQRQLTTGK